MDASKFVIVSSVQHESQYWDSLFRKLEALQIGDEVTVGVETYKVTGIQDGRLQVMDRLGNLATVDPQHIRWQQ